MAGLLRGPEVVLDRASRVQPDQRGPGGEPPVSHEVMLQFIRRTRSATGFHCKARLDTTPYGTGRKVSDEERRAVRLKRRPVLPRWNYIIYPRR